MHFRPCIDIHNGKVKQIVGASLRDSGNAAKDNFISDRPSEYYADLYKKNELENAHVIILNSGDSEFYKASRDEAKAALREYSGHMMVGGGITAENAAEYLDAGAVAAVNAFSGLTETVADTLFVELAGSAAEVEAQVANVWEAVHTLLAYGENCVVLGGDEVLRLMRQRVAAMARNYDLLAFDLG